MKRKVKYKNSPEKSQEGRKLKRQSTRDFKAENEW